MFRRISLRQFGILFSLMLSLTPAAYADEATSEKATKPVAEAAKSDGKPNDGEPNTGTPAPWVEELTTRARKSVVVISFLGRDGRPLGLGTGFVISPEGLIVTNLHVIGEARPI